MSEELSLEALRLRAHARGRELLLSDLYRYEQRHRDESKPFWSAQKFGERWAFSIRDKPFDGKRIAAGYVDTLDELLNVLAAHGAPRSNWCGSWCAHDYHKRLVADRKRKRAPARGESAAPVEHVWEWCAFSDEPRQLRILRKTKCFIFVESPREEMAHDDPFMRKQIRLDRAALERGEEVSQGRGWWGPYYALDKPSAIGGPVESLEALGLDNDATEKDVRQAYRRLAKLAHPDQGGTDEDFIKLRRQYEAALRIVGAG